MEEISHKKGVDIQLRDISIGLLNPTFPFSQDKQQSPKYIIKNLNVLIPGGSLFAILGGSGSGKTTLLNVLAKRYNSDCYKVDGQINFSQFVPNIGFVTQIDYLSPNLTVKETLRFIAKLKISPDSLLQLIHKKDSITQTNSQDNNFLYNSLVDEVILDLGLTECANTLIGDDSEVDGKRGLSGGEKRRVSIAIQILTDPKSNLILLLY